MSRLRKIKVEELEIGMYFSGFEASWMDHPFWKNKFLIKDAAILEQAHGSGIADCWIDIDKGKDLLAPSEPLSAEPLPEVPVEPVAQVSVDPFFQEIEHAQLLCENAKVVSKAMFNDVRLGKVIDMTQCAELVDQITASVMQNSFALISVARLKIADDYVYMHSVAVCALMVALGRTLGMDKTACAEAGLAGFLHDVGKAFIPLTILHKPSSLSPMEYEIAQRHPTLGYNHLVKNPGVPAYASDVCMQHHERIDGSGYPNNLSGAGISRLARMTAICDVYDALTSERPYKKSWDPSEALSRMASWTGHFDKTILSAFVKTLGIYPIGSLLKMESGRMALVIRQNPHMLTRPVLKTFLYDTGGDILDTEIIDLSLPGATDSIRQRGGEDWLKFNNLDHLWIKQ
jgi:HD-GYP domain-containing protein (c-di-GMP phosphodiesterase class II)